MPSHLPVGRQHRLKPLSGAARTRVLRPSFSTSSLFPRTTRLPRPTCVSDGYPFRRLLLRSKAPFVVQGIATHDRPPVLKSHGLSPKPIRGFDANGPASPSRSGFPEAAGAGSAPFSWSSPNCSRLKELPERPERHRQRQHPRHHGFNSLKSAISIPMLFTNSRSASIVVGMYSVTSSRGSAPQDRVSANQIAVHHFPFLFLDNPRPADEALSP